VGRAHARRPAARSPGAALRVVEYDPVNRRILAALSYGHLATDLSQGAIPALLPVFRSEYHLSYTQLGLIVLLANVSSSVIQPAFGVLSDRVKMYWLMPTGMLVASAGIVLAVTVRDYPTLVAMICLSGLGVAAFHPEGYKHAGRASGVRRATGMSYFSVGGNLGYGLGPAATSIAITWWGKHGIAYSLPFAIVGAVVMWRIVSPWAASHDGDETAAVPSAAPRKPIGSIAGRAALWVVALLVTFVVLRSWIQVGTASYIPLYFTGVRHMSATYGGVLVSVFLGAGGLGTLLGGVAADRWGHRNMLIVSMAMLPPFLWMIPRTSGVWVVIAALIAGMAVVSTFAVAMVMAQNAIPHRLGLISGLIIGFAIGMGGVGTTLLGGIADRWGVLRAMDVTALLPAAALAIALVLPKDARPGRNSVPHPSRTCMSGANAGGK